MANVRINKFESFPLLNNITINGRYGNGTLNLQGVYIPGSLSFNNVILALSQSTTNASATISFGLYSLNAGTLSLANSASSSFNSGANALRWFTLSTSATQDITPGNWYFGLLSSTAGNSGIRLYAALADTGGNFSANNGNAGQFVYGRLSVSTSQLPSAINTTDLQKVGAYNAEKNPAYILITA